MSGLSDASYRYLIAVEGPSDARRLRILVGLFLEELCREPDMHWLDRSPEALADLVATCGLDDEFDWFDLHKTGRLEQRALGRRVPFGRPVGRGEAGQLRRFLRAADVLLRHQGCAVNGVIWLRDTDGDIDLEDELHRSIAEPSPSNGAGWKACGEVVIGCPHQCFEAWLVLGAQPEDHEERADLEALTSRLGFDPTTRPDRLHHQSTGDRSAKEVARVLAVDRDQGEHDALRRALSTPGKASERIGLARFHGEACAALRRTILERGG